MLKFLQLFFSMPLILVNIDTGLDTLIHEFYGLQVCRELEPHSGQII